MIDLGHEMHHHVSRVIISNELVALSYDAEQPNLIQPCRWARVITVNGEIWDRCFAAFELTEAGIVADWDANHQLWTRHLG